MPFNYFDIHSHLNLSPLDHRSEELVLALEKENIGTIVVGIDSGTSEEAITLAHRYPNTLWAVIGLHPTEVFDEPFAPEIFEPLAWDPKVVGIGECGLDYYRNRDGALIALQKKVFKAHIELALKVDKSLMLHIRPEAGTMTAYHDALDILDAYKAEAGDKLRGNAHFFVGDIAVAQRFLDLGFTMSFDGPITFTTDYDEVIKYIPIESIMCETDAPFAAPAPYRGQTNLPTYVPHVYRKIATLKGMPVEDLVTEMAKTIKRVWGIE